MNGYQAIKQLALLCVLLLPLNSFGWDPGQSEKERSKASKTIAQFNLFCLGN